MKKDELPIYRPGAAQNEPEKVDFYPTAFGSPFAFLMTEAGRGIKNLCGKMAKAMKAKRSGMDMQN